jgi:hypothetical protein
MPVEELNLEAEDGELRLFGDVKIVTSTGAHLSSSVRVFACVVCGHIMPFLKREHTDVKEQKLEQGQISK